MSGPPPPPKRKNRQSTNSIVGAGHNVARSLSSNNVISHSGDCAKICSFSNEPDSIIGEGVEIYGDFHFDKLLRINGKFHGKLISKGDLIVSSQGCIVGNISSIKRMVVDGGNVVGDIVVEELLLNGNAIVKGNISCKLFQVIGQDVSIIGRVNIQPLSPELVDQNDNIVASLVKKPKKSNKPFPPSIVVSPIRIGTEVTSSSVVNDTRLSTADTALLIADSTKSERAAVDEARLEHLRMKERRQAAANEKAANCVDVVKNEDGNRSDATGSDVLNVNANVKSSVAARSVDDCVDESVASLAVLSDGGVVISPPHNNEESEQHNAPSDLPECSDGSIDRSKEIGTEMPNLLLPSSDQGEEQRQLGEGLVSDVGDQVSNVEKAEDHVPSAAHEDIKTEWGDHREEASPEDQPNPPEISTTILEPPASTQVEATVIRNEEEDHAMEIQSNAALEAGFSLNDMKQQFNTMADTVIASDEVQ